jgi:bifunctional UDP-N-acetylglucosamine pyrophosphorylase / glucosamine-1-phosphate N-acetyltransferase
MSDTKVVILAAGKGTRMKAEVPKPLVKIAGKPMIGHLLDRVEEAGIDTRPVVVVSPDGLELFKAALGDRVDYVLQTEQLGTGHALKSAREACGQSDNVLVLYGDHPFIEARVMHKLTQLAKQHPSALVMLTAQVPNFDGDYAGFMRWGRVLRDAHGKVTALREYKDATEAERGIQELNPAIYVFPAPWVWESLDLITNQNASGEYYLTDLVERARSTNRSIVTEAVDALQVIGINTPEELQRAEHAYLKSI